MKPFFAGHIAAAAIFGCTLAVWAVFEIATSLNRRAEATPMDRGSARVLRVCTIAGFLLAVVTATNVGAANIPYGTVTAGTSVTLIWVGIAVRWWSVRTLGRYFTFTVMTSTDQPVITAGPYRFVRHPSYSAILLILAGIGLTYGNWLSLASVILFTLIGLVNRMRVEEAALASALGDAYASYAAGRPRLIPFVW